MIDPLCKNSSSSSKLTSQLAFDNKKSKLRVATLKFAKKLNELLSYEHTSHAISWNTDGTILEIRNEEHFTNEVLPMFFKLKTSLNFIRKLNLFGFKKVKNYHPKYVKAYYNPLISRDCINDRQISMKVNTSKLSDNEELEGSINKISILTKRLTEVKKKQFKNIHEMQSLQSSFAVMDEFIKRLEFDILRLTEFVLSTFEPACTYNFTAIHNYLILSKLNPEANYIPSQYCSDFQHWISQELPGFKDFEENVQTKSAVLIDKSLSISDSSMTMENILKLNLDSFKYRNEFGNKENSEVPILKGKVLVNQLIKKGYRDRKKVN